jgi:hypothetical protein
MSETGPPGRCGRLAGLAALKDILTLVDQIYFGKVQHLDQTESLVWTIEPESQAVRR